MRSLNLLFVAAVVWLFGSFASSRGAPEPAEVKPPSAPAAPDPAARTGLPDALGPAQWGRVEQAVDRALSWLARQQEPDGSFQSMQTAQPAVTSLCILAFLSRGHQPGAGPYGRQLTRAVDFVLKCQQPDGLLCHGRPESVYIHMAASHTATYNHAIAGLMLGEVFGCVAGEQSERIKQTLEKALAKTRQMQHEPPKQDSRDEGGWRYLRPIHQFYPPPPFSDLSVTSWHLMFLRSAKNAGFRVPDEVVAAAMAYVQRCFEPRGGEFYYRASGDNNYYGRGMMGAGILSLSLGGQHQSEMARRAGEWVLSHPFNQYGDTWGRGDRFHYGAYYCSQAMAQLGGRYWQSFFPPLVKTFLQHQQADGSWPPENGNDDIVGPAYTTALSVLTLTPPFQLLPIYQR